VVKGGFAESGVGSSGSGERLIDYTPTSLAAYTKEERHKLVEEF